MLQALSRSALVILSVECIYRYNNTQTISDSRCHIYSFFNYYYYESSLSRVSASHLKFPSTASIRFTELVKVLSNYVAAFIWHGFMVFESYFPHLL